LSSLRERAYEDEVDVVWQLIYQILKTGIAHECNVMFFFAPHGYDLGHDARKIGIHDARVQCSRRSFGGEVDDGDT